MTKAANGKTRIVYFCQECGYESSKWLGQCPACHGWNTFVQEEVRKSAASRPAGGRLSEPTRIQEVSAAEEPRFSTGFAEMDRVLGGGIVPGSLILIGGDPGIGKSTLLLQVCRNLAQAGKKVLYVSGEESKRQIRMRADRIGEFQGELLLLAETDMDRIEAVIGQEKPQVAVIDSIQTVYREDVASAPGSVSQVRESTNSLMNLAKGRGVTIFLVGHVTKEGMVAGPRVLEHMVDTVLYFEGDRTLLYRILRAAKNRFGATNELGVFEMIDRGLREVDNPSAYLLEGRAQNVSGTAAACLLEGNSPLLIEIQALVCQTVYNVPRRTSTGIDFNRVNMLMAVLEKRMGFRLGGFDAYINVTGGLRISDPATDLAVIAAIISNLEDTVMGSDLVLFGEVGLAGEVRAVSSPQKRVQEAARLGFTRCILPSSCMRELRVPDRITCIPVRTIREALTAALNR